MNLEKSYPGEFGWRKRSQRMGKRKPWAMVKVERTGLEREVNCQPAAESTRPRVAVGDAAVRPPRFRLLLCESGCVKPGHQLLGASASSSVKGDTVCRCTS